MASGVRVVDDVSWFPDGKWLVVIARADWEGTYLASAGGDCMRPFLPRDVGGSYVDVSPEGDRLVIIRGGDAFLVDLRAAAAQGEIQYPLSCP